MLTKEEERLLEQASVKDELDAIKDQKKDQNNDSILPQKWKKGLILALLLGLLWLLAGVILVFYALGHFVEGFPVALAPAALCIIVGLLFTILSLRGLSKKARVFGRSIMVSPDGEIPDFPEETIARKPNEGAKVNDDRPMEVKKIYSDDPEKRAIALDKKKVERVMDHNITFPKLCASLKHNLATHGYEISNDDSIALIGALAFSRLIFIQGVNDEEAASSIVSALGETTAASFGMVDSTNPVDLYLGGLIPTTLPNNKGHIVGVKSSENNAGLPNFFASKTTEVGDYSANHKLPQGGVFHMNLVFLYFLQGTSLEGLDPILAEKSSVVNLVINKLDNPSGEAIEEVRSTGDEIRYLALKEKGSHFLSDVAMAYFDEPFELAEKKGHRVENDVENGLECEEAAFLLMGYSDEKSAGMAFAQSYLPYLSVALSQGEITEEGGLREIVDHGFTDEEASAPVRNAFRRFNGTKAKGGKKA